MSFLNLHGANRPGKKRAPLIGLAPASHGVAFFGALPDTVELDFVFDFDPLEAVVFTGPAPFPGRVFLLRFWRHAKDGVMYLLGYHHHAGWRDPTYCYPHSYMEYHKRSAHGRPGFPAEPADSTGVMVGAADRKPLIDRLVARVPMLELEPGVYLMPKEVTPLVLHGPPLISRPARPDISARRPVTEVPIKKQVLFKVLSARFQSLSQADQELSGIVKILKQFPELRIVLEGNYQGGNDLARDVFGRGPAARAYQDQRFPLTTGAESYPSTGALMDARAKAIKQRLINSGIRSNRITLRRGQLMRPGSGGVSVTIIFSNP